jgi:hypothetical protein
MNPRAIFPLIMFVLAGASFVFGGWQYFQARAVATASQQRMAFIVTTIQKNPGIAAAKKKELYASIMQGLPSSPSIFSLDFSGSFASQGGDVCTSDGQRAICTALKANSDVATFAAVCGACNPQ